MQTSCSELLIDCRAPAVARGCAGGRVPERWPRFVDRHGGDQELHRYAAAHVFAHVRRCGVRRERVPAANWSRISAPNTPRSAARAPTSRAAFPRTIWHTEIADRPHRAGAADAAVATACASGLQGGLTGEGADEVFGGYDLFKEAKIRRFLAREPQSERCGRASSSGFTPTSNTRLRAGRAFTHQFFFARAWITCGNLYFAHIPRWTTTRRIWQFFSGDVRERLERWDPYRGHRANSAGRDRSMGADGPGPVRRGAHAACRATCCARRATASQWPAPSRVAFLSSTIA